MISLVIQGPINKTSINNLDNYRKYFNRIVFSCWTSDDISEIPSDCIVIRNEDRGARNYNQCNIYRQTQSTLGGLSVVNTGFVVKVRSDESYSDMSRFVKTVLSNPDKLVSNNIWFTTDCDWHIGDHVLGGQTKHLINTFERVREICEQTSIHSPYIPLSHFGLDGFHGIPEPIICLSYLQSKGIAIKDDKANKIMREHTEVVCVSKMGNFIVRSNGANWTITSYNEVMRLAPRVISSLENL